jgi:abequosyltransferase
MILKRPLLTIAIPTWNRCEYLRQTLSQLRKETVKIDSRKVEVLVCDNASPDDTPAVVEAARAAGLSIRSIRNTENIGSDANIAQCFNLAQGEYVLILGDDDLLVDDCLFWLLPHLETRRYGVVSLRAYGFEADFRAEFPGEGGKTIAFASGHAFLVAVNARMTSISSSVLHKALVPDIDANVFCGGNLVQVHLVIQIALRADLNLFVNSYKIACKRNNSVGYNYSRVFVYEFGKILDQYRSKGLPAAVVREIETRMIVSYLPFYYLRQRMTPSAEIDEQAKYLIDRFEDRLLFWIWIYPVVALPRPLAIGWGFAVTFFGRILNGDLRRGWHFFKHRLWARGRSPRSNVEDGEHI